MDSRPAALLPADPSAAPSLSGQTHRRLTGGLSAGTPVVSRSPRPTQGRHRLPSLPPIPLSPDVGGLRQAALWQSRPRTALSRAVHPSCRHLQPPARHGDPRRRVVSVEGLPPREPGADADARRRRISPSLPPARPPEALRPHPLFRLPRVAAPHPRATPVSPGACRRPNATGRTARRRTTTNVVALSPLRCPHAHRRTADCTTALPSRAPRERHT